MSKRRIRRIKMVGDRVIITNRQSVAHFSVGNMPIAGELIKIDPKHHDGNIRRPYLVRFDDGRESWWQAKEIARAYN